MKTRLALFAAIGAMTCLLSPAFSTAAYGHDVPNIKHTHAFQKTGYGKVRQGHYVNGAQGSIIVWSPGNAAGYGKAPVKFARPSPILQPPGTPVSKNRNQVDPAIQYGKR